MRLERSESVGKCADRNEDRPGAVIGGGGGTVAVSVAGADDDQRDERANQCHTRLRYAVVGGVVLKLQVEDIDIEDLTEDEVGGMMCEGDPG